MEKSIVTVTGPSWTGVRYFSTQVHGGYSQGAWQGLNLGEHCGDDPRHVAQNRVLLRQLLPSEPHWLQQVHGTQLYHAAAPCSQALAWEQAPQADAAWTASKRTVLAILTADCLPVVIADQQGQIVGVAHAGWRGLAAGVLEKLYQHVQKQVVGPAQWHAWIGPAISQTHFEVGAEVLDAFAQLDPRLERYFIFDLSKNKYQADLAEIARFLLLKVNSAIKVSASQICTFDQYQNYYSYRKKGQTGRIVTLAWLV